MFEAEFEGPVVATVAVEIAVVVATAAAGTLVAVAAAALDPVAVVALQSVDLQQVADFLAEKPSPRFAPLVPVLGQCLAGYLAACARCQPTCEHRNAPSVVGLS